jgi:hypothetical protein
MQIVTNNPPDEGLHVGQIAMKVTGYDTEAILCVPSCTLTPDLARRLLTSSALLPSQRRHRGAHLGWAPLYHDRRRARSADIIAVAPLAVHSVLFHAALDVRLSCERSEVAHSHFDSGRARLRRACTENGASRRGAKPRGSPAGHWARRSRLPPHNPFHERRSCCARSTTERQADVPLSHLAFPLDDNLLASRSQAHACQGCSPYL